MKKGQDFLYTKDLDGFLKFSLNYRNLCWRTVPLFICCCCLPCNHCSNWTWVVEEISAFGNMLRSTHCMEFNYLKLCRARLLR